MTRFRLSLAFFIAVLVSIWARPPQVTTKVGADAERFAQVAAESAARPLRQWAQLTFHGQPFYERPPLGMIIEALTFRAFGSDTSVALHLTQVYATLLALVVLSVPLALGAGRASHYALLGLLCLPGFWIEARNPVLEMPLALTFAASMLASAGLYRICSRDAAPGLAVAAWNSIAFALTTTAVFLLDGLKALAAFIPLFLLAWLLPRMRPYAAFAVFLTLVAAGVFAGGFELARHASGLPPFIPEYLRTQWHTLAPSPTAFLWPFSRWYGAVYPALAIIAWKFWKKAPSNPLVWVASAWCVTVLLLFPTYAAIPAWYVHPVMPGAAWLVGDAFASVMTPRWERTVAFITAVVSLAIAVLV